MIYAFPFEIQMRKKRMKLFIFWSEFGEWGDWWVSKKIADNKASMQCKNPQEPNFSRFLLSTP